MHRLQMLVVAVLLSAAVAMGQTGAGANVNASASQSTSVSASQSGPKAESNTSAGANTSAQTSHPQRNRGQSDKRGESGSASSSGSVMSGTVINAALVKPVDARKNKAGDTVMAKTTQDVKSEGHVVIPRGSRIIGHVTQATARGAGTSESSLGIMFDHAILKNGQEVPLNTRIQAIAAAQNTAAASGMDGMDSMSDSGMGAVSAGAPAGGGLFGGVGTTAGVAGGAVANTPANLGGTVGGTVNSATSAGGSLAGSLKSTSSGVVGLPGMTLYTATSAAAQGSIITSPQRNIHLDSGTQMLLKVTGTAAQQ